VLIKHGDKKDDLGVVSFARLDPREATTRLLAPLPYWKRLWAQLRASNVIPITLGLGAFIQAMRTGDHSALPMTALVTTAGVNYLAADFLSSSSNRINAFQWSDCGTGTTAATISQTALVSPAGTARVSGAGTNPVAGTYQSVATIAFTGSLAITEYGLFSAASNGTMWDRRVFSAINVNNGDSIQFTYSVIMNAGGS
jgi:hypothetical protein